MENFILVQRVGSTDQSQITRVVRSYLTKQRADQDCNLLNEEHPLSTYAVVTVEHIDD